METKTENAAGAPEGEGMTSDLTIDSDAGAFNCVPDDEINIVTAFELSGWECHLFGGAEGSGVSWIPAKGQVPNAFWRWMQFLFFGNRWRKVEK